ncbi:MAG TPA: cytochrome P450 [Acidimicrobiia bacterium]
MPTTPVSPDEVVARYDRAEFYVDAPNEQFAYLRQHDPVHWYEDGPFWVITKYEDIRFVSKHPELFPSSEIAILGDIIKIREGMERPPRTSLMLLDPPDHLEHRKVLNRELTPARVNEIDGPVRDVIRETLDSLPAGNFDAVELLAEPIPVNVFANLLGVPRKDWRRILHWATLITASGGGTETQETMAAVYAEVVPYLEDLLEQRRAVPDHDFLTLIAEATVYGRPLTPIEVVWWAIALLAAGSETTQSLIAGLVWALTQHPDQAQRILADPSLAAAAVEETLRWWTPVVSMARQAKEDVELRGKTIRSGEAVLLAYGSGNRDEEEWGDDADQWNIDRPSITRHLAFGFAEHFCLGAHLARREVRILIEELARRASGIELTGPVERRDSTIVATFNRLPVRLT